MQRKTGNGEKGRDRFDTQQRSAFVITLLQFSGEAPVVEMPYI